jgi:hypothetical protein
LEVLQSLDVGLYAVIGAIHGTLVSSGAEVMSVPELFFIAKNSIGTARIRGGRRGVLRMDHVKKILPESGL